MYNFSWQKLQEKLFSIRPNFFLARTLQVFKMGVGAVLSQRAFVIFVSMSSSSASGGCQAWLKIGEFRAVSRSRRLKCLNGVLWGWPDSSWKPAMRVSARSNGFLHWGTQFLRKISCLPGNKWVNVRKWHVFAPVSSKKMSALTLSCRWLQESCRSW